MTLKDTLFDAFVEAVHTWPDYPFLAIPPRHARAWNIAPDTSYRSALEEVERLAAQYRAKGYGEGDRVALAFESRPQHFFHYLALNALGACIVPLNTDLTPGEIGYMLGHAECCAIVGLPELLPLLGESARAAGLTLPIAAGTPEGLPVRARSAPTPTTVAPAERPAAILYTSGTTGHPKGCVLSNTYVQVAGRYYAELQGEIAIAAGRERIMNPLPLYHMNSMVTTAGGVMMRGACLVLPGRFSGSHWWQDVVDTRTTRFHYLGIMVPALLAQPECEAERRHGVKRAFGAGVDPAAHERFERRFGIDLHEVWGMTETGRFLIVDREPRHIDTRACGRPQPGLEAKIVDEQGFDAADGVPGELVVRHSASDPRFGFFSGYLKDAAATEAAWAGGWFHSGDICQRSADGMFFFVDRRKNIVRRSGENISSAEVEAALAACPLVAQVAVVAVPDELRDEEVLACVVLHAPASDEADAARALFEHAQQRLAYYKLPGWVRFVDTLPVTGTQKIQKHLLFPTGFAAGLPRLHDLRAKKRSPRAAAST